jgi:hypothetical protein
VLRVLNYVAHLIGIHRKPCQLVVSITKLGEKENMTVVRIGGGLLKVDDELKIDGR